MSTRYEIRLDPETDALLVAIERHEGVNRAAAIRMLVREGARKRKVRAATPEK